jgi:hypothetical protein
MDNYEYFNNENYMNYGRGDYIEYNIGGIVEGVDIRKKDITPEMIFDGELWGTYNVLDNYITEADYKNIKSSITKFKQYLSKNPSLIIIAFITLKKSKLGGLKLGETISKKIQTDKLISILMKENGINALDILRYCRYIRKWIPILEKNIQE